MTTWSLRNSVDVNRVADFGDGFHLPEPGVAAILAERRPPKVIHEECFRYGQIFRGRAAPLGVPSEEFGIVAVIPIGRGNYISRRIVFALAEIILGITAAEIIHRYFIYLGIYRDVVAQPFQVLPPVGILVAHVFIGVCRTAHYFVDVSDVVGVDREIGTCVPGEQDPEGADIGRAFYANGVLFDEIQRLFGYHHEYHREHRKKVTYSEVQVACYRKIGVIENE